MMCIEMLGQVLEIKSADNEIPNMDANSVPDRNAIVNVDGDARQVSLAVLDLEDTEVGPGDWILSHTGLALRVLEEADARKLQNARTEMYASLSAEPPAQTPQPEQLLPARPSPVEPQPEQYQQIRGRPPQEGPS